MHNNLSRKIDELIKTYGWQPIESKNQYMVSYVNEANTKRINYYFTSHTIQIQDKEKPRDPGKVLKNVDPEMLENHLSTG